MERTDIQKFRRTLEALLRVLEQPLGKRDQIAIEPSGDALDQVQGAANREMAVRQLESESGRLRELRQAIRRVDEGTYGVCIRCDSEISVKRLNAVPWAAYCLNCQDQAENRQERDSKDEIFSKIRTEVEVA
jgi:RNA polymerase-binding transcription factor